MSPLIIARNPPAIEFAATAASNATSSLPATHQGAWSGGFNVASVDLIAMVVSDAGLASTEPQWWNASPLGCILLGPQPRGGWQVMQRAVQWGEDSWAHFLGVSCKFPILYAYFACSIRNRLEVWRSERFFSPMEEPKKDFSAGQQTRAAIDLSAPKDPADNSKPVADPQEKDKKLVGDMGAAPLDSSPSIEPIKSAANSERIRSFSRDQSASASRSRSRSRSKPQEHKDSTWNQIDRGLYGTFAVRRPTKLIDGSRGGQAFMCSLFAPEPGKAYGVEEQARLQLVSILLLAAGLAKDQTCKGFVEMAREDFEVGSRVGAVFGRLLYGVLLANILVIGLIIVVFYALWYSNVLGSSAPYVIQLCSLSSWAAGAVGLMIIGGNPRVRIDQTRPAPRHIQARLDDLPDGCVCLEFGSLHGSVFVNDQGACGVPCEVVKSVCRWRLQFRRGRSWYVGMAWFSLFLMMSIVLQIAGSTVATTRSEIMSIALLIATSVLRGAGISGHESWMIPKWKRRRDAVYAVKLQGQILSRASVSETG